MSITDLIQNDYPEYADTDIEWVLFVKDHRELLLETATLVTLSIDDLYQYKYRPGAFLRKNKHPLSTKWIFMWINMIPSDEYFGDTSEVYFVNLTELAELRRKFKTYRTTLNKLS